MEVFVADVGKEKVLVAFLLEANRALGYVATDRLIVIGCTALGAKSTGHPPFEVSASFSSGLERSFAVRASVANSCE